MEVAVGGRKKYSSRRRSPFIRNDSLAGLADDATELEKKRLAQAQFSRPHPGSSLLITRGYQRVSACMRPPLISV